VNLFALNLAQWIAAAGIAFSLHVGTSVATTVDFPIASAENFSGPGADPFAIPSLPLSPQWRL
jgi:hypothetical protein